MGQPLVNDIFLSVVTSNEINQILGSLKNDATGHDEMNTCLLKPVSSCITEPMFRYTSDDSFVFNNYRPVHFLCVVSKVFEKVLYRLLEFIKTYQILPNSQFRFRKSHSIYMTLITIMDQLITSLKNYEYVLGISVDFSKAFLPVDHTILLTQHLKWIESYLSSRKQYVTNNGMSSITKTVKCGVPRGSILGPLLILIHINDLWSVCKYRFPISLAHDTNLF